jgi:hypothetical protein
MHAHDDLERKIALATSSLNLSIGWGRIHRSDEQRRKVARRKGRDISGDKAMSK